MPAATNPAVSRLRWRLGTGTGTSGQLWYAHRTLTGQFAEILRNAGESVSPAQSARSLALRLESLQGCLQFRHGDRVVYPDGDPNWLPRLDGGGVREEVLAGECARELRERTARWTWPSTTAVPRGGGAVLGGTAGLVVGLFAPPLLAATAIGAGIGAVVGKLSKKHHEKEFGSRDGGVFASGIVRSRSLGSLTTCMPTGSRPPSSSRTSGSTRPCVHHPTRCKLGSRVG